MIANRKFIIDDLKAVMSGILRPAKFISTRVTPDFIWEDPLERLNSTIQILKVSKSQKQFFLKLHCPPKDLHFWQISALASKMGQIKKI